MIQLDFSKGNGLLPAVVQDIDTNEVLMLAYINKESWGKTIATGFAHYYSRSRNSIWKKGETSGHTQVIREIRVDCDLDTVLFIVTQNGGSACHEGYESCFFRSVKENDLIITGHKRS